MPGDLYEPSLHACRRRAPLPHERHGPRSSRRTAPGARHATARGRPGRTGPARSRATPFPTAPGAPRRSAQAAPGEPRCRARGTRGDEERPVPQAPSQVPYLPVATRRSVQLITVGAGAAGMYTALCASQAGARVALVSATPLAGASSYWAQGGLAAAISADDSPESHSRTRSGPGAAVCASRQPGSSAMRHRARSRAWPASGSASTRTVVAGWRWASRAATRSAASSTPAVPPPAGA